jgi:hypothetical protein
MALVEDTDKTPATRADDSPLRAEALRALKNKRDFQGHFLAFVLINGFTWTLWALVDSSGFPWPALLSAGWGIGLVFHAWDAYGRKPFTEEQIEREVRRLEG